MTVPPSGLKETALSIRLRKIWPSLSLRPDTTAPAVQLQIQHELDVARQAGELVDLGDGFEQMRDVDRLGRFAAQFGIEARGMARCR